jgi:hypothetical protein
MAKQENLVKKIKSNLCGVFLCKNGNYECISYENDLLEIPKSDKILTPLVNTKSRSRLPIYYKSPFVTVRRRNGEINNDYEEEDIQQKTMKNLHSTKINENIETPKLPLIPATPPTLSNNKATSTMIYEILSKSRKIELTSPNCNMSNIRMCQQYGNLSMSSLTTSSSSEYYETASPSTLSSDSELNIPLFQVGSIYSCIASYKSQHDGDLTIKYAERIQIIKDDGDEFVLVKKLSTHQFGYVPRLYILPVEKFLSSL